MGKQSKYFEGWQTLLDTKLAHVEGGWADVCWQAAGAWCSASCQHPPRTDAQGTQRCDCSRNVNSDFSGTVWAIESTNPSAHSQWHKTKTHYLCTESSSAWSWDKDTRPTQHTELEVALKETQDSRWGNSEFHFHHNIMPTSLLQKPTPTKHAFPERSGFLVKPHKKSALLFHSRISGSPLLILELLFLPNTTTPGMLWGSYNFMAFAPLSSL